jgi:RHS repeat-associated protein
LVVDTVNGAVVQRMDYDAYGTVTLDTNPGFQPFGFAGGLWDAATGLVRFGARDYDPAVARWTARDPIGFESGDQNLYAYVANDPINLTDSSGLSWRCYADVILNFGLNLIPGVPILEALGLLPVDVQPFQAAADEASLFTGGGFFDATNSVTSLVREYQRTLYELSGGDYSFDRLQDLTTRRGFQSLSLKRQEKLVERLVNLERLQRTLRLASRALAVSVAFDAVSGLLSCACRQ